MLHCFSSPLSFKSGLNLFTSTFKITFPNIDDKFYLYNYLDWQDVLSSWMLSKYSAIQMLVPHASATLVVMSCVLAAFALLFASVLALFLLWMKIQCWDPLLFWEPCRLALQAVLSLLHAQNACVISYREYMFSKHPSLPAAPLYDLSSYC